jgi:hypothetical protein
VAVCKGAPERPRRASSGARHAMAVA